MTSGQVFVSYSHTNRDDALLIYDRLQSVGFDAWIDKYGIKPGQPWDRVIQQNLESSTVMLLIHTKNSFDSDNVWDEWSYFLNRGKVVIPLIFEDTPLPFRLERLQFIDFVSESIECGFNKLLTILTELQPDPDPSNTIAIPNCPNDYNLTGGQEDAQDTNINATTDQKLIEYLNNQSAVPRDSHQRAPITNIIQANYIPPPDEELRRQDANERAPFYVIDFTGQVWSSFTPDGSGSDDGQDHDDFIMDEAHRIVEQAFNRTMNNDSLPLSMEKQKL